MKLYDLVLSLTDGFALLFSERGGGGGGGGEWDRHGHGLMGSIPFFSIPLNSILSIPHKIDQFQIW